MKQSCADSNHFHGAIIIRSSVKTKQTHFGQLIIPEQTSESQRFTSSQSPYVALRRRLVLYLCLVGGMIIGESS